MTASSPSAARAAVDELEGLLAKATPGPWWADEHFTGDGHVVMADGLRRAHLPADTNLPLNGEANAGLIAAAVNALPHLLTAVKAVDAELDALDAESARFGNPAKERDALAITARIRAALALAAVDVTETAE